MTDPYEATSPSLPLRACRGWIRVTWGEEVPWNGRRLTLDEKTILWKIACDEYRKTERHDRAAQAAQNVLNAFPS